MALTKTVAALLSAALLTSAGSCLRLGDDAGRLADDAGRAGDDIGRAGDDAGRAGDDIGDGVDDSVRAAEEARAAKEARAAEEARVAREAEEAAARAAEDAAWVRAMEDVDALVASELRRVDQQAGHIVARSLTHPSPDPVFVRELEDTTRDLILTAACDAILKEVAPEDAPDEPGRGWEWVEPAREVIKAVSARWNLTSLAQFIHHVEFAESVVEDGERVAYNLQQGTLQHAELVKYPASRRAAVLYVKTCYAPPN